MIFEGLHTFYLPALKNFFNITLFVDTEEKLRTVWKLKRDINKRGATLEKVLTQIQKRKCDFEKYVSVQKNLADILVKYELRDESISIDELINAENIDYDLKIKSPYELNNDQFLKTLKDFYPSIDAEIEELDETSMSFDQMIFKGPLKKEKVAQIGEHLLSQLPQLLEYKSYWHGNYLGIVQLYLCHVVVNKMRQKL